MRSPTPMICRPFCAFSRVALHNRALRIIGEHGQHAGQCATARGCHVQSFAQRHKANPQGRQLLQRIHEIDQRASPAVEPPHNHKINFPPSGCHQEFFPFLSECRSRTDILYLDIDRPAPLPRVIAHGGELHRQRLLVMSGNSGVETCARLVSPWPKTLFCGAFETVQTLKRQDSEGKRRRRLITWLAPVLPWPHGRVPVPSRR